MRTAGCPLISRDWIDVERRDDALRRLQDGSVLFQGMSGKGEQTCEAIVHTHWGCGCRTLEVWVPTMHS